MSSTRLGLFLYIKIAKGIRNSNLSQSTKVEVIDTLAKIFREVDYNFDEIKFRTIASATLD